MKGAKSQPDGRFPALVLRLFTTSAVEVNDVSLVRITNSHPYSRVPQSGVDAIFFAGPEELRAWFQKHGEAATELWVGFYRKDCGKPSVTWPESVDEALAVGWIDGIRKSLDPESYVIRFSPRRRGSIWSATNVRRVQALMKEKRMTSAGLAAFAVRRENKTGVYSYEQTQPQLPEPYATEMRKNKPAWTFFQSQPPSYRKMMAWWVVSAKQEQTRRRRLERLLQACLRGQRLW